LSSEPRPQWVMTVTVYHGPAFGHSVEVQTVTRGRNTDTHDVLGTWKGVGVPWKVYTGIMNSIDAILAEHLVSRYGVQEELTGVWGEEPEPF